MNRAFPTTLTRDYERRLLEFCASRTLDQARWAKLGSTFFMAGIAVMLASRRSDFDRRSYLGLAEQLHPGASTPEVFAQWLKGSPLRPSRFLPMLAVRVRRTAQQGS